MRMRQNHSPIGLWMSGSPETFEARTVVVPAYSRGCGYSMSSAPPHPHRTPPHVPSEPCEDNMSSDGEDEPYYIHRCPFSNCQHHHFHMSECSPDTTSPHFIYNISNTKNKCSSNVKNHRHSISNINNINDQLPVHDQLETSTNFEDPSTSYLQRCSLPNNKETSDENLLSRNETTEESTNNIRNERLEDYYMITRTSSHKESKGPSSTGISFNSNDISINSNDINSNDITPAYRHCAIRFIMQRLVGAAAGQRSAAVEQVRRTVLRLERAVFRRAACKEQYIEEVALKVVSILEEMQAYPGGCGGQQALQGPRDIPTC